MPITIQELNKRIAGDWLKEIEQMTEHFQQQNDSYTDLANMFNHMIDKETKANDLTIELLKSYQEQSQEDQKQNERQRRLITDMMGTIMALLPRLVNHGIIPTRTAETLSELGKEIEETEEIEAPDTRDLWKCINSLTSSNN